VAEYDNLIYFRDKSGLYVNLFVPSEVTWDFGGNETTVRQETHYPESDTTTLTVRPQQSAAFDLSFRVPGWAQVAAVKVNGEAVRVEAPPENWVTIRRTWNPEDRVVIQLRIPSYLASIDKQHRDRVAVMHGPVVLVRRNQSLQIPKDAELTRWLGREVNPLEFQTTGRVAESFVPFYRIGLDTPYVMYFDRTG